MLSSQDFRDDHSESVDVDVKDLTTADQTGKDTYAREVVGSPLKQLHPGANRRAIDDIDSDELQDDPEANLDKLESPLLNQLRGMQEPDPEPTTTATGTGGTSAVLHQFSDSDECPP